jgi:hypothetical protein
MSSSPLRVKFDASDFESLGAEFSVFKGEIQEAVRRAVKTTTQRIQEEAISEFVKVSGLRVSGVRKRMFLRYKYADGYGRIWWGLSPVSLALLSPRRSASGVRAGPVSVAGGFMPGGDYKRSVFKRRGRERLPIDKQFYEVRDMGEGVIREKIEPVIESIFKEELRDELLGAVSGATRAKRRTTKRFKP